MSKKFAAVIGTILIVSILLLSLANNNQEKNHSDGSIFIEVESQGTSSKHIPDEPFTLEASSQTEDCPEAQIVRLENLFKISEQLKAHESFAKENNISKDNVLTIKIALEEHDCDSTISIKNLDSEMSEFKIETANLINTKNKILKLADNKNITKQEYDNFVVFLEKTTEQLEIQTLKNKIKQTLNQN